MQIICGQCRHLFDAIDGAAATCPKCGHEVLLGIDLPPAAEVEIEADDFASIARSTMERKVHVICSRCNKTLTVGARLAGKKRKCPACQAAIPGRWN